MLPSTCSVQPSEVHHIGCRWTRCCKFISFALSGAWSWNVTLNEHRLLIKSSWVGGWPQSQWWALCGHLVQNTHTYSHNLPLSAAVLPAVSKTLLYVCVRECFVVSVVKVGPPLCKFSFRVTQLQQTRAGPTRDAPPLSHKPHFLKHTTAAIRTTRPLCPDWWQPCAHVRVFNSTVTGFYYYTNSNVG